MSEEKKIYHNPVIPTPEPPFRYDIICGVEGMPERDEEHKHRIVVDVLDNGIQIIHTGLTWCKVWEDNYLGGNRHRADEWKTEHEIVDTFEFWYSNRQLKLWKKCWKAQNPDELNKPKFTPKKKKNKK